MMIIGGTSTFQGKISKVLLEQKHLMVIIEAVQILN